MRVLIKDFTMPTVQQRGASMVETLIVLPMLVIFFTLAVQLTMLYRARITLEYAANQAARAGALNNALPLPFVLTPTYLNVFKIGQSAMQATSNIFTRGSVWQGLVNGMLPLYVKEPTAAGMAHAWINTNKELINSVCIEYLNPTQQTFIDWGFMENYGPNRWVLQIPNDTLRYRKPIPYEREAKIRSPVGRPAPDLSDMDPQLRSEVANKTSGAANILHLRITYGYEMKVPLASQIIKTFFSLTTTNTLERYLLSQNKFPLVAEGVAGMQTPPHWHPFYSFGPPGSHSFNPANSWSTINVDGDRALEAPNLVMLSVFGFIRDYGSQVVSSALATGMDSVAESLGSKNAFCPVLWKDGFKDPLKNCTPNPANPGTPSSSGSYGGC